MSDAFETVAVTWSQPEAAVIASFLAWHGIDSYALSRHAQVEPPLVTALGGIPIRVPTDRAAEATALLGSVEGSPVIRPSISRQPIADRLAALFCFVFGGTPPPRVGSTVE